MKEVLEERNSNICGTTPEERIEQHRKKLTSQIIAMYRTRETLVSQFNQKLFNVILKERLRETQDQLERCIQLIDAAQRNYKKHRKKLMNAHWKITRYFSRRVGLTTI